MSTMILKKAAQVLRKQGKDVLAKALESQVETMAKAEHATREMPQIKMYFQDGKVIFQSPDPGYMRRKALAFQLRKVGVDPEYKGDGIWHFRPVAETIGLIKQVYADFFSDAPGKGARPAILIGRDGKPYSTLPFSSYHKGVSSMASIGQPLL
jgi:hypothetical protein